MPLIEKMETKGGIRRRHCGKTLAGSRLLRCVYFKTRRKYPAFLFHSLHCKQKRDERKFPCYLCSTTRASYYTTPSYVLRTATDGVPLDIASVIRTIPSTEDGVMHNLASFRFGWGGLEPPRWSEVPIQEHSAHMISAVRGKSAWLSYPHYLRAVPHYLRAPFLSWRAHTALKLVSLPL